MADSFGYRKIQTGNLKNKYQSDKKPHPPSLETLTKSETCRHKYIIHEKRKCPTRANLRNLLLNLENIPNVS